MHRGATETDRPAYLPLGSPRRRPLPLAGGRNTTSNSSSTRGNAGSNAGSNARSDRRRRCRRQRRRRRLWRWRRRCCCRPKTRPARRRSAARGAVIPAPAAPRRAPQEDQAAPVSRRPSCPVVPPTPLRGRGCGSGRWFWCLPSASSRRALGAGQRRPDKRGRHRLKEDMCLKGEQQQDKIHRARLTRAGGGGWRGAGSDTKRKNGD